MIRNQAKPGEVVMPWNAEGFASLEAAARRFMNMVVREPLELVKDDKGWLIRLKPDANLPGAGNGFGNDNLFYNDVQTATASCPAGTAGPDVSMSISANLIGSPISKADANSMAQEIALINAQSGLSCSIDTSINNGIDQMLVNSVGEIVIHGRFTQVDGYSRNYIAVLDSDLSLKPQAWKVPLFSTSNPIKRMCLDADDNIYIVGSDVSGPDGMYWQMVAQFSPSGGVVGGYASPTFAPPTITGQFPATFDSPRFPTWCFYDSGGNQVIIGGNFTQYGNSSVGPMIAISTSNGALGGFSWSGASSFSMCCSFADGGGNFYVARFTGGTDGFVVVDGSGAVGGFQPWLYTGFSYNEVRAMALLGGDLYAGGAVWVVNSGGVNSYGIVKLDASTGQWDNGFFAYTDKAFTSDTDVSTITAQGSQILVGGLFSVYNSVSCPANLFRLNSDGSPDYTWTCQTNGRVMGIIVEPSGTILVCGYFTQIGPSGSMVNRSHIARLSATGSVL